MTPKTPRKLNLAFVEDPLLATAAANAPLAPQNTPRRPGPQVYVPTISNFASPLSSPGPYLSDFSSDTKHLDLIASHGPPAPTNWDCAPTVSSSNDINTTEPQMVTHAKVYAIAEKYQIMGLKTLARRKFATQVQCHHTSEEFPHAMAEVYESTIDSDRGLRDVIINAFRQHPNLARRRDVGEVVRENPTLAWELFRLGWGLPIASA
jgi:hypothetical protein